LTRNRFGINNLGELNEQRRVNRNRQQGVNEESEINNRETRRENGDRNSIEGNCGSLSADGFMYQYAQWLNGGLTVRSDETNVIDSSLRHEVAERVIGTLSNRINAQSFDFSSSFRGVTGFKYIKHYDYIPDKFIFHETNNEDSNLFFGIELEIDGGGKNDDNAKFIQKFLGVDNCYIMSDGSLGKDIHTGGLEITTHPCTLNYHKQLPYQELFKKLVDMKYKSHDTSNCGYHIHINRNYFSDNPTIQDLCITKILYLLEKFWDDVKKVARRDSNQYSQRFNMKEDESMFELLVKAKGVYSSKYNMVNLQHKDTIEFRLFKGTLKYETFIATIEFVSNLAKICKRTPLEEIQNVTFQDIMDIEPTEYLVGYLNGRNNK
jgi:hypothetical protein